MSRRILTFILLLQISIDLSESVTIHEKVYTKNSYPSLSTQRERHLPPSSPIHVTVTAGHTASLGCPVGKLGDKVVSWLQRRGERIILLTYGTKFFISERRYKLNLETLNNWKLEIRQVQKKDGGNYVCQISTYPPTTINFHLKIVEPSPRVTNMMGVEIKEIFYRVGSTINLKCSNIKPNEKVRWIKLYQEFNITHSVELKSSMPWPFDDSPSSSLTITKALSNDSGMYFCESSGKSSGHVKVHVLEEENPAAMQYNKAPIRSYASFFINVINSIILIKCVY